MRVERRQETGWEKNLGWTVNALHICVELNLINCWLANWIMLALEEELTVM